jgi:hypothetical protein
MSRRGDVFTQVVTHLFRTASQKPDYIVVSRFTNKPYNILIKKGDPVLRAYLEDDFQTAVDSRRTGVGGKPIAHKGLQRSVVDLLWF